MASKLLALVRTPVGGCEYHRQLAPNQFMGMKFDIEVKHADSLQIVKDWNDVEAVQVNNSDYHNHSHIINYMRKGLWSDFDDYWEVETRHPLFHYYKHINYKEHSIDLIERSDVVTTTNERLAEIISKFNKNVHILPNFISPVDPQFQGTKQGASPFIRFGWVGAKYHINDVKLLRDSLDKLYSDQHLFDKYRVIYGGYITDGEGRPEPNSEAIRGLLLGNNNAKGVHHFGLLKAQEVNQYATMYHSIDVALAPLEATRYNECKSELKIVEAGHFGIPVIASDVYPYNRVIEHGVDGFLVKNERAHKDWKKYMETFIHEPELVTKMGAALNQKVNRMFNADEIVVKRKKILESL